jgi:hypothetical protein
VRHIDAVFVYSLDICRGEDCDLRVTASVAALSTLTHSRLSDALLATPIRPRLGLVATVFVLVGLLAVIRACSARPQHRSSDHASRTESPSRVLKKSMYSMSLRYDALLGPL